jgi:hypothetical protein
MSIAANNPVNDPSHFFIVYSTPTCRFSSIRRATRPKGEAITVEVARLKMAGRRSPSIGSEPPHVGCHGGEVHGKDGPPISDACWDHEPAPKACHARSPSAKAGARCLSPGQRPGKPTCKNATGLKGRANARGVEREARPYRPPTFHHIYTQAWRPGLRKNRPFGPHEFPGSWRVTRMFDGFRSRWMMPF